MDEFREKIIFQQKKTLKVSDDLFISFFKNFYFVIFDKKLILKKVESRIALLQTARPSLQTNIPSLST